MIKIKTLREIINEQKITLTEEVKIVDGLNEFILTRGKLEGPSFKFYLDLPALTASARGEYWIKKERN